MKKRIALSGSIRTWPLLALAAMAMAVFVPQAKAVPAYSRQVNMPCTACHVGGFGPQLTPFGRQFKLTGYTIKAGSGFTPKVSLELVESFTHTQKDQSGPAAPGFGNNDNWEFQTAGLYLAGAISDHMGMFMQASYSQNGHTVGWDMTDIRYARTAKLGSHTAVWGLTVNNNPTISDIYNTGPAWQYPYTGPDLAPGAVASPIINGGFMNGVLGLTAYTQVDGKWYVEAGAYKVPSKAFIDHVNGMYPGRLDVPAPYLRVAYQASPNAKSNLEVGALYFEPKLHPMGSMGPGSDDYKDYGLDASYEWFGGSKHAVTVQGQYLHETQTLNNSYAAGNASNLHNHLSSLNMNANYYYENTYGVTVGAFTTSGSSDSLLYSGSSTNNSPNTNGGSIELNWVPFGKADSWAKPYLNLRVGLQYIFYTKFNGTTSHASDNNTLYLVFQSYLF
ncbi:MAG TPA: cytochrome C [Sulfuriferula sp.]|nr:cytochrome C [Sulfuriferula sp.]